MLYVYFSPELMILNSFTLKIITNSSVESLQLQVARLTKTPSIFGINSSI
jgi:hypothetical protein